MLLGHPDVAQAVAFGVPDEKYGEEVRKSNSFFCFEWLFGSIICLKVGVEKLQINCAVIPREGVSLDEAEITKYCKKNLASFKVPKKVFITDSVPKTATGKIQRRIVAEHFLAQMSAAKVPKFGA